MTVFIIKKIHGTNGLRGGPTDGQMDRRTNVVISKNPTSWYRYDFEVEAPEKPIRCDASEQHFEYSDYP